jgi:hypothetical protein
MKIAILSRNRNLYSTKRLIEAAEQRGHEVVVLDHMKCVLVIEQSRPHIYYNGKELTDVNAVIPRIGASATFYGSAVVRQFEMMKIFTASFHIQEKYFRLGSFMSGSDFLAANNYNFHLQYGLRKETEKYNLSAFLGPSYSYFKRPLSDTVEFGYSNIINKIYSEFGVYGCVEAIYKVKYDVGLGGQVFCDYNKVQLVYGVRLVAYFSSSYRGIKYGRTTPKK